MTAGIAALGLVSLLAFAVLRAEDPPAAGRSPTADAAARRVTDDLWFLGDFESGTLAGWFGDLPRPDAAQVVGEPVRRGRHAVRLSVAPGDRAAAKERSELRLADRDLERRRGGDGQTLWYAMSLFLPAEHVEQPGGKYPILAQWHHRPDRAAPSGRRAHVTGPPPLALYLLSQGERQSLLLVHHPSPAAPRRLGERPIARGRWIDLLFEVRWSTGPDGYVRAWVDGAPLTAGIARGPTLYNPHGNYLRLGYYRAKGGTTTDHVFFDEVRIGGSRSAVMLGRR